MPYKKNKRLQESEILHDPSYKGSSENLVVLRKAIVQNEQLYYIYRIYCEETGISYVGQSRDLCSTKRNCSQMPNRVSSHFTALNRGAHANHRLQDAHDRYGATKWEILEVLSNEQGRSHSDAHSNFAVEREVHWQRQFDCDGKINFSGFYQLRESDVRLMQGSGIANSYTIIYLIFKLKNPFCDRPVKIKPLELTSEWGISEASVYRALARFKEEGLIGTDDSEITFYWKDKAVNGFSNVKDVSQKCDTFLKSEKQFSEVINDSQECKNETPEPSSGKGSTTPHTIQTNSNYSNSLIKSESKPLEKEKKPEKMQNPVKEENPFSSQEENKSETIPTENVSLEVVGKDKFFGREANFSPQRQPWNWLADISGENAPWLINGKLDPNFHDWLAHNWMRQYSNPNKTIHDYRADVMSHFSNKPHNLPIRWEQYRNETAHHLTRTAEAIGSGIEVSDERKQELAGRVRAITAEFPEDLRVTVDKSSIVPSVAQPQLQAKQEPAIAPAQTETHEPTETEDRPTLDYLNTILSKQFGQKIAIQAAKQHGYFVRYSKGVPVEIVDSEPTEDDSFEPEAKEVTIPQPEINLDRFANITIEEINHLIQHPDKRLGSPSVYIPAICKEKEWFCRVDGLGIPIEVLERNPSEVEQTSPTNSSSVPTSKTEATTRVSAERPCQDGINELLANPEIDDSLKESVASDAERDFGFIVCRDSNGVPTKVFDPKYVAEVEF